MLRPALRSRRWRTLAGMLAALLAAPAVAIGSASVAQADTVRQQELWVLNAINVAGAWQHTHGSGVTVALIDSGVNGQVSDLAGSVTNGRDFSGVNTPPTDPNWGVHGTWMASLIAGHGHAGGSSGIIGVAPEAKILSIRAVTDQGDPGYHRYQHEPESRVQQHLADAINYATSKRVSVVSMSLGYQGPSLAVRRAISAALAQGIVVVASSGNSGVASSGTHGNAPYSFPADYPGVLGVGAVAQDGLPAGFSSDNLSVQVAAPGVRVPAQGRDGQYWLVSGTSPACALTAGVAALIKSVFPALTPALVVQAITLSTRNKPHGGYDEQVGSGTVDATAALRMASRLAHDQDTAHGLVAAAQFGGGTAAIPPVPVAPRTKGQFLVDSLIALVCLAAVLILVFRLIATRTPAAAGMPGGWAGAAPPGPGAPGGWAGAGPPGPAASGGWAGGGAPDPRASEGWAGAGPPGPAAPGGWAGAGPPAPGTPDGRAGAGPPAPRPSGGWAEAGPRSAGQPTTGPRATAPPTAGPPPARPPSAGLPVAASGTGEAGSGGGATADDRSAPYRAPEGYKPSTGYPSPTGYGSSDGVQPPAGHGPPTGSGLAAGDGLSASPLRPGAQGASGVPAAPEALAGSSPDAKTGPVTGFGEPVTPHDPGSQAGDPPAADDDTWPSSGRW
jgi:Subtilase family